MEYKIINEQFGKKENHWIETSIDDYKFMYKAWDDDGHYCGSIVSNQNNEEFYGYILGQVASLWGAVVCDVFRRSTINNAQEVIMKVTTIE